MSVFVKGLGCKMDGTGEGGGGGEGVARGDDCIYKLQFITLSSVQRPLESQAVLVVCVTDCLCVTRML